VWLAGLADEPEVERRGRDVDVFVAQCRQPVRVVGILGVADPDQRGVEQPNGGGDDAFERELAAPHVGVDPLAQDRQRMAEVDQRLELGLLSGTLPFGVVPVLLAPLGIAPGRLDVTLGVDAEPHVGPRRRHHQPAQALDRFAISQRRTLEVEVDEAAPAPPAAIAGRGVVDVDHPVDRWRVGDAHRRSPCRAALVHLTAPRYPRHRARTQPAGAIDV